MPAGLRLNNLRSRSIRSNIVGSDGVRSITSSGQSSVGLFGRLTSFFGNLFNATLNFGGWIIQQLVSTISFSFTGAWGLFNQVVANIYNFNWQTTDEQLDQQLESMRNALIGQYGGALGNAVGWLACGVAPAAGIFAFNELLGAYLLKEVGEEALDEISGNIVALLRSSFRLFAQEKVINTFKNTRKTIKKWNEGLSKNSWERKALDYFFAGRSDDLIRTWGDKDRKPWSFRIWVEQRIESIQSEPIRNFVEEFYDELIDSCVEAGYVIAGGLDTWVLQQQMTADAVHGQQRLVTIQPDRESENETITLAGNEQTVRAQLPQVLAQHQMIENRDIGQWVGETIRDSTRANPSELTVRLLLYSEKKPPYSRAKQRTTITLHDFNSGDLNWRKIKNAIGGATGYTYGRFRGTAKLSNGRQLVCYCSTDREAEDLLKELEKLIDPDIQAISITEERRTGARANGKPLQKQPIKIYPAYLYIESKQRILNQGTDDQGFQTLDGTYNTRRFRVPLFTDEKPTNFDEIVRDALRVPGIN